MTQPDRLSRFRVTGAPNPHIVDGWPLTSRYVEWCYAPVLGPTALCLVRQLAQRLDMSPDGFDLDAVEAARGLGLHRGPAPEEMGKNSTAIRAFGRIARFGFGRWSPSFDHLVVWHTVPGLSPAQRARVPDAVRELHDAFTRASPAGRAPANPEPASNLPVSQVGPRHQQAPRAGSSPAPSISSMSALNHRLQELRTERRGHGLSQGR